jgi:hypothetical protein
MNSRSVRVAYSGVSSPRFRWNCCPVLKIGTLAKAANAGSKEAVALCILAREGSRVVRDPQAAYSHLQIAILQGEEPAKRLLANDLEGFATKLTEDHRSSLASYGNVWMQLHSLRPGSVLRGGENDYWLSGTACVANGVGADARELDN